MEESYSTLYTDLLAKLESLAKRLLDPIDPTPAALWNIEKDLIGYQVGTQNAIASERKIGGLSNVARLNPDVSLGRT